MTPRCVFAYLIALGIGIALAALTFPFDFLFPRAGLEWRPLGDTAQHIVAQRYLIADGWRWPPSFAANLDTENGGVNTAFADAIPVLALFLKAIRGFLPEGFHGVGLFYGIAWVLQPVAAVWALRAAGERRLLPAVGVALAAASMPAWMWRFGHAALTGHFVLLLGIGLYLNLLRQPSPRLWIGAACLQALALFIHPYLAVMTLALLFSVPLTLALRRERYLPAGFAAVACVGALAAVMAAFGYLGAGGGHGYGNYAMNLISPVWPAGSAFFGMPLTALVDATGFGGWEGYNWLGTGLLFGLGVAVLLQPAAAAGMVWRHAGLATAALVLTVIAVSHKVGLGEMLLLDLGRWPARQMGQFRSSGRFFWPVAYILLLGVMVLLARRWPMLCLMVGLIQFIDAQPVRQAVADSAARRAVWSVDAPRLRDELSQASRLTILPSWFCQGPQRAPETGDLILEALTLASERAVPASTMYVARHTRPPACRDAALAAAPLAPGELRLILPAAQAALAPLVPDAAARCAPVGSLLVCR